MDKKQLENELDMLHGNINRMCVTQDDEELIEMQQWAKRRIDQIYIYNRQRIKESQRPSVFKAAKGLADAPE